MPKILPYVDAWYRNVNLNADGEPAPLNVGFCTFKPTQVRFMTSKERFSAGAAMQNALDNGRLAGPFTTQAMAADAAPKDAYARAGDLAYSRALDAGMTEEDAGRYARACAMCARDGDPAPEMEQFRTLAPMEETKVDEAPTVAMTETVPVVETPVVAVVESSPLAPVAEAVPATPVSTEAPKVDEVTAPEAPVESKPSVEAEALAAAVVTAPAPSSVFDDDDNTPPAPAPAAKVESKAEHKSSSSSSKKKVK